MAQYASADLISISSALNQTTLANTTPVNGNIIDMLGYESVTFDLYCGAFTTGTATAVLYESDDSGMAGATVVGADFLIGLAADFAVSAAQAIAKLGYVGKKRYLRLTITGSNTPALTINSRAIRGNSHTNPVGIVL